MPTKKLLDGDAGDAGQADTGGRACETEGASGDVLSDVPSDAPSEAGSARRALLHVGGETMVLKGRTLQFILWLAEHQARINAARGTRGQLWLTWKGGVNAEIMGRIHVVI